MLMLANKPKEDKISFDRKYLLVMRLYNGRTRKK
jgi:hypothetical protein